MSINKLFLALSMCFIAWASYAQNTAEEHQVLKLYSPKASYYLTTFDATIINYDVADKVTSRFGFKEFNTVDASKNYRGIKGMAGLFLTTFLHYQYISDQSINLKISDSIISLQPNKKLYIYGFASSINDGRTVDKNYSKLLMSAYLQEIDSDYLSNENNFTLLHRKDKGIFWKRNWINMGYGMSYLAKDNPFMGSRKLAVGFFYLWEALHYIPIFGGPFLGSTREDRIMISATGLTSLVFWKGIISGLVLGNRYRKLNNSIIDSGYKIPKNLKY